MACELELLQVVLKLFHQRRPQQLEGPQQQKPLEGLEPGWIGAAMVLRGRWETPYLCAQGRSGSEWRVAARAPSPRERSAPGWRRRRRRREAWLRGAPAAGLAAPAAVTGEAEEPALITRRSHSWARAWPMGGGRAGSGRGASLGPLSAPPPRPLLPRRSAGRTTSQLESEGAGGLGSRSPGTSQKTRRPAHAALALRLRALALAPRGPVGALTVSIPTSGRHPSNTRRGLSDKPGAPGPLGEERGKGYHRVIGTTRDSVVKAVPAYMLDDPHPAILVGWGPPAPRAPALACPPPGPRGEGSAAGWPGGAQSSRSRCPSGHLRGSAGCPSPGVSRLLQRLHGLPLGGGMRILIKGTCEGNFFLIRNVKELVSSSLKPELKLS